MKTIDNMHADIGIFAGRTGHFVGFVMLQLIWASWRKNLSLGFAAR